MTTVKPPLSPRDRDYRVVRIAAPLRQSVVESLRDALGSGRFMPGERLTEKGLCELTGVSRTLIREALRQLESEGLITVVPHRGPVVARVSLEQAEQIYRVRAELEGLAAELFAAKASDEQRQAVKEALKKIKAASSSTDSGSRIRAKNEFYACLLEGSGNEVLAQVLGLLNSRVTLLRAASLSQKGRLQQSVVELTALVDALAARKPGAARKAAEFHVSQAAKAAYEALREQQAHSRACG